MLPPSHMWAVDHRLAMPENYLMWAWVQTVCHDWIPPVPILATCHVTGLRVGLWSDSGLSLRLVCANG